MKQIVIVDDDPGVQDACTLIFDPSLFQVTIFANGSPILDQVAVIPDLYILDKQLAGVDGLDVCRFLKSDANTRNIPVIMLSASPHIDLLAQQAGADDALEKPFKIQALRALVNKYLAA